MIINRAVKVLQLEAESILNLINRIDNSFERLVEIICNSSGRVIVSGIGKSGLIGRKIAATLSSTGTNSMFLHPVEALHGDLGMVQREDVFIAISNSGETTELNQLLPEIQAIGCKLAGFTGNPDSTMARFCDIVIHTDVEREACPFNMAPTCSTTAQLAMGDALAIVLIHQKQFKKSDFIRSHPGGALGHRLSQRISEIMYDLSNIPCVNIDTELKEAIAKIDDFQLGAVIVLDNQKHVLGIITDGDIRRYLASGKYDFTSITIKNLMTPAPHTLTPDKFIYEALNLMEKYQITVLPIVDFETKLKGILHLHDILGKGSLKYNGGA